MGVRETPKAKHEFLFFATEESSETAKHKLQKRGIDAVKEDQVLKVDSINDKMNALDAILDGKLTQKSTIALKTLMKTSGTSSSGSDKKTSMAQSMLLERPETTDEKITKMQEEM